MSTVLLVLELLVVVGAIVMGVRMGGIGLGIWGVVGVGVLVLGFGLYPGDPPIDAMLIILAVITAAAAMQVAGGIDYLVQVATKIIESNPKLIVYIAPVVSYVFTVGAGTSNIFYPLIPVIYQVSYDNNIRPEKALASSTVANALGITSSPVSAAMAAMLTLTLAKGFGLTQILAITIPASIVGIIVMSVIQALFIGKPLDKDPEYKKRLEAGLIKAQAAQDAEPAPLPKRAALSAYLFLAGVVFIVLTGIFPALQRTVPGKDGAPVPVASTAVIIQVVMFTVALLIILFCNAKASEIIKQQVFSAGIIALLALFGIAWLADTFVSAYQDQIVALMSSWVTAVPLLFAVAIFIVAALTTSQSAATRTIVPIGLTLLPVGLVTAMWTAVAGVLFLPANGTQLAAVAVDETGSTFIGKYVLNHSFMLPLLIGTAATVATGMLIAGLLFR